MWDQNQDVYELEIARRNGLPGLEISELSNY